jgi:hypothetical protein
MTFFALLPVSSISFLVGIPARTDFSADGGGTSRSPYSQRDRIC